MKEISLRLGPLRADGYNIHRSGVRWLCEPGQFCRANQIIAYFNLVLEATVPRPGGTSPFAEERELQVAVAPRHDGRVMYDPAAGPGGYLSVLGINLWNADDVLGYLEMDKVPTNLSRETGRLRLLMLAGRRMTPLVDVHSGLLPGWNCRSRGWWCDEGETPVTLLSLGICDITGIVLGEECAFMEMFRAEPAPSQFVFIPDHPVAPSAPVLLDQLERTEAQARAISADLTSGLFKGAEAPTANDLMFAGTLMASLQRSPMRETYDVLSASGLVRSGPPNAVLLSLTAEAPSILRHKTLGYRLQILQHHQAAAGPAIRNWLAGAFEPVPRKMGDIKADYEKLIDAVGKATGARVLILNRMSSSGDEDISSYSAFDAPLSATLASVASKELNLMLHDVVAGRNAAVIDIDAIAANIGGGEHLPDGIHQSRVMQEILREEIVHAMKPLRAAYSQAA